MLNLLEWMKRQNSEKERGLKIDGQTDECFVSDRARLG